MSTSVPNSIGTTPPVVEHNHPLEGDLQSVYPYVLAPAGGFAVGSGDGQNVNYSVVVIVVALSVVFILSGFLHLLARCLWRRRRRRLVPRQHNPLVSALHGQLQHLFHLHDAGVEQAFINTLPAFSYGSIRGLKDSADCAVCLNEFADDDRLRLLPRCKHAFHLECIDTWLLSHSTCPLCRRSLLLEHPLLISNSHLHHGEATSEIPTEIATEILNSDIIHSIRLPCPEDNHLTTSRSSSCITTSLHNSFRICEPLPSDHDSRNEIEEIHEILEIEETDPEMELDMGSVLTSTPSPAAPTILVVDEQGTERVLKVELGKVAACRSVLESSSRKLTSSKGARSYSMGSYEYIVDPTSWKLTIAPTRRSPSCKPSHRSALSDNIPELESTPANCEIFSNGEVFSFSRIRSALLTPIMSSDSNAGSSPFRDHSSYSPSQGGDRWIDIDIERGEVIETSVSLIKPDQWQISSPMFTDSSSELRSELREDLSRFSRGVSLKQRSASLGRIGNEGFEMARVSCFRRSLSATLAGGETVESGCKNFFVAKDVDEPVASGDGSVKMASVVRKFSLNWLTGRDKRVVFSSPSLVPVVV